MQIMTELLSDEEMDYYGEMRREAQVRVSIVLQSGTVHVDTRVRAVYDDDCFVDEVIYNPDEVDDEDHWLYDVMLRLGKGAYDEGCKTLRQYFRRFGPKIAVAL